MARALKPTTLTPTDELRSLLDQLERRLPTPKWNPTDAIALMEQMDRIAELLPSLQADGVDLRPELGRLEAIEAGIRQRADRIARGAGASLSTARREAGATKERWWWYVDDIARQQRLQRLRRLGVVGVVVALVILFFLVAFPRLFPVDPSVERAQRYATEAEVALTNGDVAAALAAYRQAADTLPDDPSYRLWVGVLAERLGDPTAAAAAFDQARGLVESETQFYVSRGQIYLQANEIQKALQDADAALALTPDSAEAHFVRGSALEAMGQVVEAIAAFQQAADLATAQNNPTLVVLARVRLGYLLQSSVVQPPDTTAPTTPTP